MHTAQTSKSISPALFQIKWQQDGAPLSKISNGCADVDYRPLLRTYFSLVLLFAGVFMRVLVA